MSRLFDATAKAQKDAGARRSREEVRQRAEAVDQALAAEGMLDDADKRLKVKLSQSVQPVVYESFRVPGSKWRIEHARADNDYVIQMFPLKPPRLVWQDVVLAIIATMDSIFPRNIKITYRPPREDYQIKYYTITVEKVVGQPGWERACKERALRGLSAIDVWSE